jgi:hypothetical protein
MAIVVPIVGRRDVTKWITGGWCGRRGSLWWLATGPAAAALHVGSNAIAATLIKQTPGFGHIDVLQLTLLWCTRPRLAWMVIALVPREAKRQIYFSVAASTLVCEMLLQIIGSVYMGIATNYARRQKFYQEGHLSHTQGGKDAHLMYVGSLLWLVVLAFALIACFLALTGLGNMASRFGAKGVMSMDRIRKKKEKMAKLLDRVHSYDFQNDLDALSGGTLISRQFQFYGSQQRAIAPLEECGQLAERLRDICDDWDDLVTYRTTNREQLKSLKKAYQAARKRGPRTRSDAAESDFLSCREEYEMVPTNQLGAQARKDFAEATEKGSQDILTSIRQCLYWLAELNVATAIVRVETMNAHVRSSLVPLPIDPVSTPKPQIVAYLEKVLSVFNDVSGVYAKLEKSFEEATGEWKKLEERRTKEKQQREEGVSRLAAAARTTIFGMFGVWVAQWIWWIGYIRLSGDK